MITYEGGKGNSIESAIKVIGAECEMDGVSAEYRFLDLNFCSMNKSWILVEQELWNNEQGSYDRMIIQDENGRVREIWFDISDFFGKE